MATTVTKQTLVDGERNLVVKINFVGDADGDAANQNLIDVSSYSGFGGDWATVRIDRIEASFRGFSLDLHWDATANVDILTIPAEESYDKRWKEHGGLTNNAGAGVTGDILYSEVGMGAGDEGEMTISMVKKS